MITDITQYYYNSKKQCIKKIRERDGEKWCYEYQYNECGLKTKCSFHTENHEREWSDEYIYDNNVLTVCNHYLANGRKAYYLEYIYDDNNRLKKKKIWTVNGGLCQSDTSYKYDKKGRLTSETTIEKSGDKYIKKYKYNDLDLLITTIEIGEDVSSEFDFLRGRTEYTTEHEYNEAGLVSFDVTYDEKGKQVIECEYFYNEDGLLERTISIETF